MNYKHRLFINFTLVFLAFVSIVIVIQLNREKRYKTDELRAKLLAYSEMIDSYTMLTHDTISAAQILPDDIRFTLIDKDGTIKFDNVVADYTSLSNHTNRPEIIAAQLNDNGYSIRKSESTNTDWIYFAHKAQSGDYIRLAMPYVILFSDVVGIETILLYFLTLVLIIVLIILVYKTDKFGHTILSLKKFISFVESGNKNYENIKFPDSDTGEIGHHIIALYDQLEKSKQQTAVERERNQQMKQEMTNNIAHELKTPVSSIRGFLESIINNPEIDSQKQQHFISRAYAQTLRLADLINDISLITKLEEASSLFVHEKCNIRNIADEAIYELDNQIHDADMSIDNKLPDNMEISGNKNLLYAIFRNLIENAVHYSGKGSNIVLETENETDNDFYHVVFYDTGKGIDPKQLERIFERFVRLDEGRDRSMGGTGLGLSIVKHAVLFHNGNIVAENRINGGLLFRFSLKK